jgi:hypothetical protein
MSCPHLKEVVMLFCDAYPVKKMLPLDRIATADPCLGQFHDCPLFREAMARLASVTGATVPVAGSSHGCPVGAHKEAS